MAAIELKEVMQIIKSGEWIKKLTCITANLSTNTGGQVLVLKNCRIARKETMAAAGMDIVGASDITRDARHNFHFTVNLEMKNKQIRKIHPILITEINNQPVL